MHPETLAKLSGLELRAKRIVEGYVAGFHRSPYHGFSIEFAEHREYVPGDDLRYVDWKVFGKTDKVYLKQYEEETNMACYLTLDASESMLYQGPGSALSKLHYAQCIAASLAYLILHQQDSVGLITFDTDIRSLLRASGNPSQLKQVLKALEDVLPKGKTKTGPIFHDLAERLKKRSLVLVLSDLLDDIGSVLAGLKHLQHRRHDVIVIHILDRAELEFPFENTTLFRGLEQLPDVSTEPRALRAAYLKELRHYLKQLKAGCRAQGADYVLVATDQPLDMALSSLLASRMSKGR